MNLKRLILVLVLCVFALPLKGHAQGPIASAASASKWDVAFGVTSLSAAGIATGLTASCLAAKTCHEVMPLMKHWTGESISKAVIKRSLIQGGLHYAVGRFMKGKWRTRTLATLAVVNVADAVNDIVVTSKRR